MTVADFDLGFRPADYADPAAVRVARIKGTVRKRLVADAVAAGATVPAELSGESVDRATRRAVEAVRFADAGGEYLPDAQPGEVEIARVAETDTVLGDAWSVRARRTARGYAYRVADEHGEDWTCSPKTSRRPLTLGELIRLIDTAACDGSEPGYEGIFGGRDWSVREYGHDPRELQGRYAVSSAFYPALARWYERDAAAWVAETLRGRGGR